MSHRETPRRTLIKAGGIAGGIVVAGTAVTVGWSWLHRRNCASPEDGQELSYTSYQTRNHIFAGGHGPIEVITTEEGFSVLRLSELGGSTRSFVQSTEFDEEFLLAVDASSRPGRFEFIGIERLDGDIVHSYSCTMDPSENGVADIRYFLLRVEATFTPTMARHTMTVGTDDSTVETEVIH